MKLSFNGNKKNYRAKKKTTLKHLFCADLARRISRERRKNP
jgi:hypothetical protein